MIAQLAAGFAPEEPPADALVFGITTNRIRITWEAVRAEADLPGLRLHDLRHAFASVLASGGLSLPIIGALLGHSTPATTARYAHLLDDPLRQATDGSAALDGAVDRYRRRRCVAALGRAELMPIERYMVGRSYTER